MSKGRVLFVRSSTTSSSRRQCDGGGRSGLFSLCNSSYSLWCPLWPLASGLWPLASGQRRLISGTCSYYWRRRIQYTSRLVFAFFDSIIGGVFLSIQGWLYSQETGSGPSQLVNISEIYRGAQKSQRDSASSLRRDLLVLLAQAHPTEGFCLLLEKGLARTTGAGPSNILAGQFLHFLTRSQRGADPLPLVQHLNVHG